MLVATQKVMCTAKPDPKPWSSGGRSGISYRVTLSDGKSALDLRCSNDEVYNKIEPFGYYQAVVNIVQAAQDDRIVERVQLVDVQIAGE